MFDELLKKNINPQVADANDTEELETLMLLLDGLFAAKVKGGEEEVYYV